MALAVFSATDVLDRVLRAIDMPGNVLRAVDDLLGHSVDDVLGHPVDNALGHALQHPVSSMSVSRVPVCPQVHRR